MGGGAGENAAAWLAEERGDRVRVLRFDVTDADAVAAAGEQVMAAGPLHGGLTAARG